MTDSDLYTTITGLLTVNWNATKGGTKPSIAEGWQSLGPTSPSLVIFVLQAIAESPGCLGGYWYLTKIPFEVVCIADSQPRCLELRNEVLRILNANGGGLYWVESIDSFAKASGKMSYTITGFYRTAVQISA